MLLNVPFIPEPDYVRFLGGLGNRLYAVHFSLYDPVLCDARVRFQTRDLQPVADLLKTLLGPKKYLLANGRFHSPDRYLSPGGWTGLIRRLERLREAGALDGIIYSDPYLLTALSDAAPDLTAGIEAVPSVNFMIDTIPKLLSILTFIEGTGFLPPEKISLDRALNRRPAELAALAAEIRRRWPETRIELLANEGCLNHCPYRSSHDALIAAANAGLGADTFRLNRDLGCMRILSEAPERIFASPFIRPEDLDRYEAVADIVKVCGRTLGGAFLEQTVGAYAGGRFEGNLLELLDAAHGMAERWEILNSQLPERFYEMITGCDQDCRNCGTCRELFRRHARTLPVRIGKLHGG